MFVLFYDIALFLLAGVSLPYLAFTWVFHKKYRNSLLARLGIAKIPSFPGKKVIWIHACSMGEMKVAKALALQVRKEFPEKKIVISSITETGQQEAKKSISEADGFLYLPLDFSFIMKRVVRKINPETLFLAEGEFWYNLVRCVKEEKGNVALVSGKLSERSRKRLSKAHFFTKRLFSYLDLLCVQNAEYGKRFVSLGISPDKVHVTGNLKFDAKIPHLSSEEKEAWMQELGITKDDIVITIGSTHEKEEDMLLKSLETVQKKIPQIKILVVPRHPHRFEKVSQHLSQGLSSFGVFSKGSLKQERVVLVDKMGVLCKCFEVSSLAIVAGSFIDSVGGHNILEPLEFGVPVLFGPHMYTQKELVSLVVAHKAGFQVNQEDLADSVLSLLENKDLYAKIAQAGLALMKQVQGSTERTLQVMQKAFYLS